MKKKIMIIIMGLLIVFVTAEVLAESYTESMAASGEGGSLDYRKQVLSVKKIKINKSLYNRFLLELFKIYDLIRGHSADDGSIGGNADNESFDDPIDDPIYDEGELEIPIDYSRDQYADGGFGAIPDNIPNRMDNTPTGDPRDGPTGISALALMFNPGLFVLNWGVNEYGETLILASAGTGYPVYFGSSSITAGFGNNPFTGNPYQDQDDIFTGGDDTNAAAGDDDLAGIGDGDGENPPPETNPPAASDPDGGDSTGLRP